MVVDTIFVLLLTLFGTVHGTPCQLAVARNHFIVVCSLGERTFASCQNKPFVFCSPLCAFRCTFDNKSYGRSRCSAEQSWKWCHYHQAGLRRRRG